MYDVNELMQILIESNSAFAYCCQYFIEQVTDSYFVEYLREKIAQGLTEREVLSEYLASWIPWEDHADKIVMKIKELAGE